MNVSSFEELRLRLMSGPGTIRRNGKARISFTIDDKFVPVGRLAAILLKKAGIKVVGHITSHKREAQFVVAAKDANLEVLLMRLRKAKEALTEAEKQFIYGD